MIHEIVTIEELEKLLKHWIEITNAAVTGIEEGRPFPDTLARRGWDEAAIRGLAKLLADASMELEEEKKAHAADKDNKAAFIASHPNLSAVQALMHIGYTEGGFAKKPAGAGAAVMMPGITDIRLDPAVVPAQAQPLFYSIFDEPGVMYLTEGAKALVYRKIHGEHPFSEARPVVALGSRARVYLIGDWATGVDRARQIARMVEADISQNPGIETHVIHLGDTYFAGWPKECRENFLAHWPQQQPPNVRHWSLNGNHDMYCGGDGYFQVLLGDPRFAAQKKCSNFCIGNEHWQLIGLDTAYAEWRLAHEDTRDQVGWAQGLSKLAPNARRVLLSHHQPFSDYESQKKADALAAEAAPLLKDERTAAWFWGHEHRCVVYQPLTFASGGKLPLGACLGHGGVPCKPTKKVETHVRHALTNDPAAGGGVFKYGIEKFALMGYAILDLDGKHGTIRCIHEKGVEHFKASI